ncbi:MAG: aminoacyl-tRNA hydrolase [Victivallaceae bacterium]|nr:aminoacyl-tRNA hydrolase [Victivallaceae bacterium]
MDSSRDGSNAISLIVGLGNPGAEYAASRHNCGFTVIEKLLAGFPAGRFEESSVAQSRVFSGKFRGKPLTLQMPLTFMNLSGKAVAPLCRKLEIAPENVLVIVDDMDLPLGRLRLRKNGASGGHNGLKSIIEELQSEKFNRLRVGIGHPEKKGVVDFVLSGFEGEEKVLFDEVVERAAKAVQCVLKAGMATAMNEFNAAPEPVVRENQP